MKAGPNHHKPSLEVLRVVSNVGRFGKTIMLPIEWYFGSSPSLIFNLSIHLNPKSILDITIITKASDVDGQ